MLAISMPPVVAAAIVVPGSSAPGCAYPAYVAVPPSTGSPSSAMPRMPSVRTALSGAVSEPWSSVEAQLARTRAPTSADEASRGSLLVKMVMERLLR